jgi:hypothetical protein
MFSPTIAKNPDPAAARIARAQAKLEELAEMGMDVARSVHNRVLKDDVREAMNERRPGDALDLSILAQAFERAARSVRITLALQTRLDHPPRLAQPRAHLAEAAPTLDRVEGPRLPRDREPTIERDHDQALTLIDRCLIEAAPLPEPIPHIVRRICQDLAAPYDPDLWTDAEPPKSPARLNHPKFKPRTTRTTRTPCPSKPHPLPP